MGNGKTRVFSIARMKGSSVCPVAGLEFYMSVAKSLGIDLSTGYIFRIVDDRKRDVLDDHVSYSTMYDRLKYYLAVLGIDQGESLHSFRCGSAITLGLSSGSSQIVQDHIGWASDSVCDHYSRLRKMERVSSVSSVMASAIRDSGDIVQKVYCNGGDIENLPLAFI